MYSTGMLIGVLLLSCLSQSSKASYSPVLRGNSEDTNASSKQESSTTTMTTFHQSGFGGQYNVGHYPSSRRSRRHLVEIPQSANKHAIPSLTEQNIVNEYGHWYHDEHKSPFASKLYDRTDEELEQEQEEFEEKMKKVREEWGAWEFTDRKDTVRPFVNFENTPYRDMLHADMDKHSWQSDETYVKNLISEGKKLIDRVTEGIYAEYGHATEELNEEEIEARNELFRIVIDESEDGLDKNQVKGISWMTPSAFSMLVKKLLHAMITNDEFYVILGGHSSAAGHGNNFSQTKMMSFHLLMEPVFEKLGVRLVSKNLAMGGLGTIHFSFGQGTLYGERDVIFWDSEMTEKDSGPRDFFNKQALLNGERVPILMTNNVFDLKEETSEYLWHGNLLRANDVLPLTEDMEQVETMPYATRYMVCGPIAKADNLCGDKGNPQTYNSKCWVPRSNFYPKSQQRDKTGGRAGWHPGFRQHQFAGRQYALTMLHGLKAALELWENGIAEQWPLKEEYWHVGEHYKIARETLVSNMQNEENIGKSLCEKKLVEFNLPLRMCRTPMNGMTEFTPKNLGDKNSIRAHIKPAPNGYKPTAHDKLEYEGFDLMPLEWKIPEGHIDVHAIAIATNYKAPVVERNDDEGADIGRRQLIEEGEAIFEIEDFFSMRDMEVHRQLGGDGGDDEVIPGQGWTKTYFGDSVNNGYCDGTSTSMCGRSEQSDCLMYGHNDGHGGIAGDGLSGWLVIQIPRVRYGLIGAKFEYWSVRDLSRTREWTEVNNGLTYDVTPYKPPENEAEEQLWDGTTRKLKATIPPFPEDSQFDFAINGKIMKTMDLKEFETYQKEIGYNVAVLPILDDEEMAERDWDGESMELGIRLRSETQPRDLVVNFNHIYYA